MIDLIVKSIKKQLADAYSKDNIHIYDEDIPQDFKEPCFYISVLNTSKTSLLKERFILNVPVVVQYFPNNKSKYKKTEINNKIMELLQLLKAVKLYDEKLNVVGMLNAFNVNSEVVDNVLSFFVEYKPTMNAITSDDNLMDSLSRVIDMMNGEYTKKELLTSKRYAKYRDLVNALLDDNKRYSIKQVDKLINNYLKKGV